MGVLKMPMHLFFVRKPVIVGQKSNVDVALDANVGVLFLVAKVQKNITVTVDRVLFMTVT